MVTLRLEPVAPQMVVAAGLTAIVYRAHVEHKERPPCMASSGTVGLAVGVVKDGEVLLLQGFTFVEALLSDKLMKPETQATICKPIRYKWLGTLKWIAV